jgi:NarL family two-component system response regulator LiaR
MTRAGLSLFLNSYKEFELVGEAASCDEAINFCEQQQPDVVLMDLQLPGTDGLGILDIIKNNYPAIKVLVLTSYHDPSLIERALQKGASGYLLKDVSAYDLAGAIRSASQGRSILTNEIAESLMQVVRQRKDTGFELTKREKEVLVLLVEGLSNFEIAERLLVSYSTVKFHVGRILSKLGAPSRSMAVTLAWQHRLVPGSETNAKSLN